VDYGISSEVRPGIFAHALTKGKKWNVLRQRTDSYAYDVDQLFLGTLLFTVSTFLLPTVVTYAALFASVSYNISLYKVLAEYQIRLGLWSVDKVLEIMTNALNAFPLFEVLLRMKEPSRLPRSSLLIRSVIELMARRCCVQAQVDGERWLDIGTGIEG
jgi:hypothetical protein